MSIYKPAKMAFAALTTLLAHNAALAENASDCDILLGDKSNLGTFTLNQTSPYPIITVNGGALKDVMVAFKTTGDDKDVGYNEINFNRADQTTTMELVSGSSSILQGQATLDYEETIQCEGISMNALGDKLVTLFCGATAINIVPNKISVGIQAGDNHMRSHTVTSCTSETSLIP